MSNTTIYPFSYRFNDGSSLNLTPAAMYTFAASITTLAVTTILSLSHCISAYFKSRQPIINVNNLPKPSLEELMAECKERQEAENQKRYGSASTLGKIWLVVRPYIGFASSFLIPPAFTHFGPAIFTATSKCVSKVFILVKVIPKFFH
jgi:hypothetical protein